MSDLIFHSEYFSLKYQVNAYQKSWSYNPPTYINCDHYSKLFEPNIFFDVAIAPVTGARSKNLEVP